MIRKKKQGRNATHSRAPLTQRSDESGVVAGADAKNDVNSRVFDALAVGCDRRQTDGHVDEQAANAVAAGRLSARLGLLHLLALKFGDDASAVRELQLLHLVQPRKALCPKKPFICAMMRRRPPTSSEHAGLSKNTNR